MLFMPPWTMYLFRFNFINAFIQPIEARPPCFVDTRYQGIEIRKTIGSKSREISRCLCSRDRAGIFFSETEFVVCVLSVEYFQIHVQLLRDQKNTRYFGEGDNFLL